MDHIYFLASTVWKELYPERKPFDQIDPVAQSEWRRFVEITLLVNAQWGR
jgi:hypothetical protein